MQSTTRRTERNGPHLTTRCTKVWPCASIICLAESAWLHEAVRSCRGSGLCDIIKRSLASKQATVSILHIPSAGHYQLLDSTPMGQLPLQLSLSQQAVTWQICSAEIHQNEQFRFGRRNEKQGPLAVPDGAKLSTGRIFVCASRVPCATNILKASLPGCSFTMTMNSTSA